MNPTYHSKNYGVSIDGDSKEFIIRTNRDKTIQFLDIILIPLHFSLSICPNSDLDDCRNTTDLWIYMDVQMLTAFIIRL